MQMAWLARGQIHLKDADGTVRAFTSEYGEKARQRAAKSAQNNAWRTQGPGAMFTGAAMQAAQLGAVEVPLFITGLSRGSSGNLLYGLETRDVGGLFAIPRDGGAEERLFHAANQQLRDPAAHPLAPIVACAIPRPQTGACHLALFGLEGDALTEVTEGDTVDRRPSWIPAEPRALVFESAGIGRDANGAFVELAPSVIQRLDVRSGDLKTIAEEPGFDLCAPRVDGDGALYYVRRPRARHDHVSPWRLLLGLLLIPFRLIAALFGWLNFFTLRYSGKPLASSGSARARQAELKQMMLWGNLVNAHQLALDDVQAEDLAEVRAPRSWTLVRQEKDGSKRTIADGVAVFDVTPEGAVLYSNGTEVFLRNRDGKVESVAKDAGVQQVIWMGEAMADAAAAVR